MWSRQSQIKADARPNPSSSPFSSVLYVFSIKPFAAILLHHYPTASIFPSSGSIRLSSSCGRNQMSCMFLCAANTTGANKKNGLHPQRVQHCV